MECLVCLGFYSSMAEIIAKNAIELNDLKYSRVISTTRVSSLWHVITAHRCMLHVLDFGTRFFLRKTKPYLLDIIRDIIELKYGIGRSIGS